MIEFPSWAGAALEVLYYAVAVPAAALSAVLLVLCMVGGIAAPIWGAIFGRLPGDRGGVEPLHPITRLVVGLVGFGLLYSLVVPWL